MSLNKTQQAAFDWWLRVYDLDRQNFDFYQTCKEFDKILKNFGLDVNSAQFFAKIFDELEYPSNWRPKPKERDKFFSSLPENIVKGKWDIIIQHIPESDWSKYNPKYKSKAAYSFVKSINPDEPLILIKEDKESNIIFSVFLGDITAKLGITKEDVENRYDRVYEAIEQELGYDATRKHIPEYISITDWPNASVIANAKYEFQIKSQEDPAIGDVKNIIVLALNKLGL